MFEHRLLVFSGKIVASGTSVPLPPPGPAQLARKNANNA
jgi:hypothetical protein